MRELFYALLVAVLVVAMWKGVAFRVIVDGKPTIVEIAIGVTVEKEEGE